MKISSLFENKKTVLSFEVFPPKKDSGIDTIYNTLEGLKDLNPDFISVTYGAGGLEAGNSKTCEIASIIKGKYNIEPVAHLTCVNSTKEQIDMELNSLKNAGIENILALRGDIQKDLPVRTDFHYASDLIQYINDNYGDYFNVAGACYPEGHPESKDKVSDILNLKKKVDAGASHLVSQLFFDNNYFYEFVEKSRIAGINVPIESGIMPVINKKQIERMVTLCGATLPNKFIRTMEKFEDNPDALRDAGIAYAVNQIVDLVSKGVDGIHLYTMNNPYVARRISENVASLFGK